MVSGNNDLTDSAELGDCGSRRGEQNSRDEGVGRLECVKKAENRVIP